MFKTSSRAANVAALLTLLLLIIFTLHLLDNARSAGNSVVGHYHDVFSKIPKVLSKKPKIARRLYPKDLMQRPLATDLTRIPRLFHQSWINGTLPAKFEEWSHSCRAANPDWEWVLWTDEDNLKLVERFAPWFLNTYKDLNTEIYRADAVRNIYMHVFGGVYADLDTECLRPYDSMFEMYNASSAAHGKHSRFDKSYEGNPSNSGKDSALALRESSHPHPERKAFLGRMGTDDSFEHSIPNAWMASTPAHPFWLLPLEFTSANVNSGASPESLTGPEALYQMVDRYNNDYDQGQGSKMDEYYEKSHWRNLFKVVAKKTATLPPQSLVILPFWEVYPYSWQRDGEAFRHVCWVLKEEFNAARCKLLLGLDHWESHSITYWSHSWGADKDGHSTNNMQHITVPNEVTKTTQQEKGAVNEWSQQAEKVEEEKKKKEQEVEVKEPRRRRR